MRVAAAISIFLVSIAMAQTTSKAHRKTPAPSASDDSLTLPIVRLTVEGNQRITTDAILGMSGLKVGDVGKKDAFEAAQKKILESGFFDVVNYGYGVPASAHPGFEIKFQVVEAKPLYPVQFAGFPGPNTEVSQYLKSRDPLFNGYAPPTQQIFERWSKYLEAYTASKNQPKKVIGKLLTNAAGDYFVQFQPDEPLAAVARVEFTGNQAISSITLENSIGAVAFGLPYSEQNFREFLDNQVKPLYEALGLMRVRFEDITSEPVPPPVKGVLVHVKVVEGPVYKLGKVGFTGADADQKTTFARVAGLKVGDTVNYDKVTEAADKIRKSVRRSGYINAKASAERKIDDATHKVDVTFKIERGAKYEFGKLTIQGLDLNGTAAVQKQWGEQPGDPYNPEYPDYFLSQIKEEGIFDHLGPTHSEAKLDDQTHTADVTLIFSAEEKKPDKDKRKDSQL